MPGPAQSGYPTANPAASGTPATSVTFAPTSPPFPIAPPAQPLTAQQMGVYLMTLLNHRPTTEIHVGAMTPALSASEQIGTALRPFAQLQQAIDYGASRPETQFAIVCAPGTYADVTIPAGKSFYVECKGKVTLTNLTIVGGGGGAGQPNIFDSGLNVTTVTFQSALLADSGALALKGFANIGSVVSTGLGSNAIVGAGLLEAVSQLPPVTFLGAVDVGPSGFMVAYNCDIQGAVTAGFYSSVDCKERGLITVGGTEVIIHETEDEFPYGAPAITFSGAAGFVDVDANSYREFGLAGGVITNGSLRNDGPRFARLQWWQQQPYAFGAATQYFYTFSGYYSAIPAMVDAASNAVREPVNPTAVLRMFEGIIDVSVGFGEEFELEILGCVHDPSGGTLLKNETLYSLDTPVVLTYAAGSSGSQRTTDVPTKLTVNGGLPATHITVAWKQVGGNVYPGTLSVNLDVE